MFFLIVFSSCASIETIKEHMSKLDDDMFRAYDNIPGKVVDVVPVVQEEKTGSDATGGLIIETLTTKAFWHGQYPQVFRIEIDDENGFHLQTIYILPLGLAASVGMYQGEVPLPTLVAETSVELIERSIVEHDLTALKELASQDHNLANMSLVNFHGTVLHLAAAAGFRDGIDFLSTLPDVQINALDIDSQTPVTHAQKFRGRLSLSAYLRCIISLRAKGANLETSDRECTSLYELISTLSPEGKVHLRNLVLELIQTVAEEKSMFEGKPSAKPE